MLRPILCIRIGARRRKRIRSVRRLLAARLDGQRTGHLPARRRSGGNRVRMSLVQEVEHSYLLCRMGISDRSIRFGSRVARQLSSLARLGSGTLLDVPAT